MTCAIAPGPIGAAHQAGYSPGYRSDCPGTPAESSLHMWPLRWAADEQWMSMAFGSDDVVYHSKGTTYYMLDRNWKRGDTHYQRGVLRTIGQSPCEDENVVEDVSGAPLACDRNADARSTVLHRGSKMVFIKWGEGNNTLDDVDNIVDCSWLDLQVIGNIRPDWYMDDRGDSTDVQYLGNQHVFHASDVPRLVKQWRKKDFANQYFVMSIGENPTPEENGIHWPLVLNIPGEGFGDDALRTYTNHRTLTDDDVGLFLIDEALEAAGGTCPQISQEGEAGGGGPPILEEPVPSNLEVDLNSWDTKVYTLSPVWEPPTKETGSSESSSYNSEVASPAITVVSDTVTASSCLDASVGEVHLTIEFDKVGEGLSVPWIGLMFRPDEECLMTPRDGSDGEVIFIEGNENLSATYGPLSAAVRTLGSGGDEGEIKAGHVPLADAEGFSQVLVMKMETENSNAITLSFRRSVMGTLLNNLVPVEPRSGMPPVLGETALDAMYLTYAIGMEESIGYHKTRQCFEIKDFPPCAGSGEMAVSPEKEASSPAPASWGHASLILTALLAAVAGVVPVLI